VIYRFQVEEYGEEVLNQFKHLLPILFYRLAKWLKQVGYLAGNLGPYNWTAAFVLGNLMAIISF